MRRNAASLRLRGIGRLVPHLHLPMGSLVASTVLLVLWVAACADDAVQPEPPNRPPTVTSSIPARTITVGDAAVIDLSAHFSDPDGDALAFAAESDDPTIATATIAENTLTVAATGQGTTDIAVTARDPSGLTATQSFSVTVPNRPPILTDSIPNLEMVRGDSVVIDLSAHFNDPDLDSLSFSVEVSDEGVALVSLSRDTLGVMAMRADTATLLIAATDPGGLSVTQMVAVAVVNRSPVLTDSIPPLEMVTGDSVTIELSDHFSDADGDTLNFSVEVSDEDVVAASVSGDTLTVVALRADTAMLALVVAATDPGGLSVSQAVAVAVANQPPVLTDSIPGLVLVTGDTVAIGLLAHFSDLDGDTLGFAIEVSDEDVVSASLSGDTATVVALRPGAASVAVTAQDPGGLATSQSFGVTVPNQPPMLADSIPALELFTSDSVDIDLLAHFSDPDGDTLLFAIESSNPAVATVSLSRHTVRIAAEARGTAEVTVTGRDPGNLTASQIFAVVVQNRQPVVTESIRRQPLRRGRSITIDLLDHFTDPDGDILQFTAHSSDSTIASASTSGSRVAVAGIRRGVADITVVAQDPSDLSTDLSFVVNVPANADRDALIALYEATEGPNWHEGSNWPSRRPLSQWKGVSVNANGRVIGLRLGHNGLVGPVPPEIGWLTELTDLDLSNNNLKGAIPPELGQLRALKHLNLEENSLTGAIPETLGDLAALTELRLYENALTGSIPSGFGDLVALKVVDLSHNQLTGPIPPKLGSLSQLEYLRLYHNHLTGPVPPELGRLRSLRELDLEGNRLAGSIPVELGRLGDLKQLVLSYNGLQGAIPPELGRLRSLEELELRDNQLTGSIPPELGQLSRLEDLSLGDNELTGPIPPELGGLGALTRLSLRANLLTGPLPPELGALRKLRLTWLHRNQLTGPLPASFGNLRNLEWLNVQENALTGPFPHSLLRLPKLELLLVADNDGICVPGVAAFSAWMETHEEQPLCNETDVAGLTALFESTDGVNWTDSRGWLDGPFPERWAGVVTDSAGKVLQLDVGNNGLSGALPSDLGTLLDRLTVLRIGDNALSGPIPLSLVGLELDEFDYADTGLCVPPGESFSAWLETIPVRRGPLDECPALSDRDVLVKLYEATDGENWVDQQNWLTDAPLGDWFGVSTDGEGRVTEIDLYNNGLTGRLPPELGDLAMLRVLRLTTNNLSGSIPPELGKLADLTELYLYPNQLTGIIPPQLGSLASLEELRLLSNELTGRIPPELAGLRNLRLLSLSDNRLSGSIPPELGRLDRLTFLGLGANRLTGRIPAALGELATLERLHLDNNRLVGSIPPWLGNLLELQRISLEKNQMSGPIPSELGHLDNLVSLTLEESGVGGPIPPELGDLAKLSWLNLSYNGLTGLIPPELGALANLEYLKLSGNSLTGSIPSEIGMLGSATTVRLDRNDLTGPLPSSVGSLASVETLDLSLNYGLGGPLPPSLTELGKLQELNLRGTDFCVADPAHVDRLGRIGVPRIALCNSDVRAYLVQAVQSREFPVPLIAGEDALLRVFVTAKRLNRERRPRVRATFFVDGREVYRTEIEGRGGTIPTGVDESSLDNSSNALIPGRVVQPGLEWGWTGASQRQGGWRSSWRRCLLST